MTALFILRTALRDERAVRVHNGSDVPALSGRPCMAENVSKHPSSDDQADQQAEEVECKYVHPEKGGRKAEKAVATALATVSE